MTEKLKQTTKEELLRMPREWQEVVSVFDWGTISEEIGKKYFLGESEINDLQVEIMFILTGTEEIADLKINIENNLVISGSTAEKITNELLGKIFQPLTDKMTENIKRSLKARSIHWQQNLDFILSGGDYTAFIRRVESSASSASGTTMADKQNGSATFNPSKLDDLKSRFTI